MTQINIGLIGYGYIGQVHTMVYKNLPILSPFFKDKYNMSLVVSKKLENTKGLGWENLYSTVDEISEETNLDIVDICTPNFLHCEQGKKFMEKGVNIYCEKPMALNYEDSLKMANLAEDKGLITQVALVYRFMPAVAKAKAIVESGLLGDIISFRGELLHSSYLNPEREMNWRLRKEQSGGGAIVDLGVHVVDTLMFVLGDNNIKTLSARTNTVIRERPDGDSKELSKVNVDDWGLIILELENESIGTIEVSKVNYNPNSNFHIDIYGTNGYLSISDKDPYNPIFNSFVGENEREIFKEINENGYVKHINSIYPNGKMSMGPMVDMHAASISNLLYNIIEDKIVYKETPTFSESLISQKIIDLSYKSSSKKGEVLII
ncbi:MAG: Gfo/Idh/MocA family oxidoreductase [Tissierellia bacterium]|nr:Gfo/Idh/MocA family oxidoreductase [Tissierellia bacterium]